MYKEVVITPHQNYTLLNFHPPRVTDEIQNWLTAEEGMALILFGDNGSGRGYVLEAACFDQQVFDKPISVVKLDWSQISSGDTLSYLKECIHNLTSIEEEQESWLELVTNTLDSKFSILSAIGVSLVINVGGLLKIAYKLLPTFSQELTKLAPKDSYAALRKVVEYLSIDQNIVLHIEHAELLCNLDAWMLDDLCRTLNQRALSLKKNARRPCRALLALSTSENVNNSVELSSLAQLRDPWKIEIKSINYFQFEEVLNRCFSPNFFNPNIFKRFVTKGLKKFFNSNLDVNTLNNEFLSIVYDYATLQNDGELFHTSLIRNVLAELLHDELLIQKDGHWQLSSEATEQEINNVLGYPVRKWNGNLLRKVNSDLRPAVKKFLQLAALCDPVIPWKPLLQHVCEQQQHIEFEILESTLRELWFEEPSLLCESVYLVDGKYSKDSTWRFTNPLLAIAERPQNISELANELMTWLPQQVPSELRHFAKLYLQLASWAGEEQYCEWRNKLNWWIEEEYAPLLEFWLEQQLMSHQIQIESVINIISNSISNSMPVPRSARQWAMLNACEHFWEAEDGVPINPIGAQYCVLKFCQYLIDDLGKTDDLGKSHAYAKQVLMIVQQFYPEGHSDLAIMKMYADKDFTAKKLAAQTQRKREPGNTRLDKDKYEG